MAGTAEAWSAELTLANAQLEGMSKEQLSAEIVKALDASARADQQALQVLQSQRESQAQFLLECIQQTEMQEADAEQQAAVQNVMRTTNFYIPKDRVKASLMCGRMPSQPPKPPDSAQFKRSNKERDAGARRDARLEAQGVDDATRPWDVRGPVGPQDGGPNQHRGQRWRSGSQRWANPGGEFREMFDHWRSKQRQGLVGQELHFWHPYNADGYFAREARKRGHATPKEIKDKKNAEEWAEL